MSVTSSFTPLSEQEFSELDTFLLSDACDSEALAIDELHGFLTALLVAPDPVAESEWMMMAWGEPHFADEAERARMGELMRRLHADIHSTLEHGKSFEPLVVEMEEEGELLEVYEGWCYGFMLGVEMNQAHWDALSKDDEMMLAPIAQLALLGSEDEPEMDESDYDAWVELIPGAVMALYRRWHGAGG